MKKVFVSGCYDIVHAGHIQFFEEARALGDYLIVSFASEPVLWHHKQRNRPFRTNTRKCCWKACAWWTRSFWAPA